MLAWQLNTFDVKTSRCLDVWIRYLCVSIQALRVIRVYSINAQESRTMFRVRDLASLGGWRRLEAGGCG
jgi:hypothetical protein